MNPVEAISLAGADGDFRPLEGVRVVSLAINIPGPIAAQQLRELGAEVDKVEPPAGDPLEEYSPEWYRDLSRGIRIRRWSLREKRPELERLLAECDLLITSMRPAALERVGLSWPELHEAYPRMSQVAIFGDAPPHEDRAGHDLTYQAERGMVRPAELPGSLTADLAAAERVLSTALALLLNQRRRGVGSFRHVSISSALDRLLLAREYGLTTAGGILGGGLPEYGVYETARGWLAVAALEPKFRERLAEELGLGEISHGALADALKRRTAAEWEAWGSDRDLPLMRLR